VIAKAGKPMVRVVPLEEQSAQRKLGFLAGQGTVTADVKKTFSREIDAMFGAAR
jgi:antitoxin (DNA-binding transcriptional repressor) of toxin-antitoxin stability system